ncbi:MAG TPA: DinB family protein [Gemmatales bacterium]|nr:DinB family protein [Gemmatales bacterium]
MDTNTRDKLVADYLAGTALLRKAIQGMTQEQMQARPIAGKMSTQEVICHIVDFEPVYVERMKRAITMEKPTVMGADENAFAAKLCYHERDTEEELNLMELTRKSMSRILKALPVEAWSREAIHNERGPMSLEKMVINITNHVPHHIRFIEEKRKALGI